MNLPGSWTAYVGDEPCQVCGEKAAARLQGETDSMGAEYSWWCDDHIQAVRDSLKASREVEHICDGCGAKAKVYPSRCWEEGSNGPVYDWCSSCRDKNRQSLEDSISDEEKERWNRDDDDEDYFVNTLEDIDDDDDHDFFEERIESFASGNTLGRNELKELNVFAHEFKGFEVTCINLLEEDKIAFNGMCGRYYTEATISGPRFTKCNVHLVSFAVKPIADEGHPPLPHDIVEIGLHLMDKLSRYGYDFKLINNVKFLQVSN